MESWRSLNHRLYRLTEPEVLALLEAEMIGECRISILERLHQRYNTLRVSRERIELLGKAKKV